MNIINSFSGKYRFLSNFYPSEVYYENHKYKTIEHAFQAAKATNSEDRRRIANADTPGDAKRLGRNISLRDDWEKVKIEVMRELLEQKFTLIPKLRNKLLETGESTLIEGNTWGDKFWGVCDGEGQNWLGKLLMEVRKDINESIQRRKNWNVHENPTLFDDEKKLFYYEDSCRIQGRNVPVRQYENGHTIYDFGGPIGSVEYDEYGEEC